ncbi:hypothetical protein L3i20_v248830 [Paenibacillus sp. L3-i20]|nr:hypothetical protein L3i20_v248830 [Paenibacillus sp. L3-i20]
MYTNEKVRELLGGTIPEEHTLNKFLDTLKRSNTDSFFLVIRLKSNNEFIGIVSLDNHIDGINTEISYELLPEWGTQTANLSSCKLLERVGMKLEQTVLRYGAEQEIYIIAK